MWEMVRCSTQEGAGWAIQISVQHTGTGTLQGLGGYGSKQEVNSLKKRYFVFSFLAVFFLTVSVIFFFFLPQEKTEPENLLDQKTQIETVYADETMSLFENAYTFYTDELEQFLDAFMELTYNCNYEERHYYNGAQEFMTEECYSYYVPMGDPEAVEGTFTPYTSYLLDADYYYRFIASDQAECMARIQYSSSVSRSDIQESFLLMLLIHLEDGWKISSIKTLDR